jgi:glycosyltransferase involved in cell wall biosynthesis
MLFIDKVFASQKPKTYFRARPHNRASVSVIVPALNESANLPYVLPRIPGWVKEIILVNGNYNDDTAEVVESVRPGVRIIPQVGKGKGAALKTGFDAATGDIIIMLDADGSTDPAEIPRFCALLGGADFVKGSRFMQGGGTADMEFHRKFGNWCFKVAVRLLYGGTFSDLCYGYMGFWRSVLPQLAVDTDGFEVETLISIRALKAHLKIAEVPSYEYRRLYGKSNLRALPDGWRVLKTIVNERFRKSLPHIVSIEPDLITQVERRSRNRYGADTYQESDEVRFISRAND